MELSGFNYALKTLQRGPNYRLLRWGGRRNLQIGRIAKDALRDAAVTPSIRAIAFPIEKTPQWEYEGRGS